MKIYLIRHGETEWNLQQRLQGSADIPLNENGVELARITAQGLKEVPFDLIYTSPLKRARQTAEILRGDRDIPLIEEPRLKEICFGIYEGYCCSPENYTIPDPAFMNFFVDPGNYIPPEGAESIAQLCRRTTEFLHEVADNPDNADRTILFSSHGAAVKGLLSSLTITDMKDFWNGGVHRNCGVTILDVQDGQITIEQENVIYYDEARSHNYWEAQTHD
ncbi:MAG: histidine phosphatase family protein [Lachnospiraceae bacterium]|nr:histidine phosphatase family protein [Lachnospiraceae bacterium]